MERITSSLDDDFGCQLADLTQRKGHGEIAGYQIVASTTRNFSPRDAAGVAGTQEQALVGTVSGEEDPSTAVYHVVRSYDPCMVCTVH